MKLYILIKTILENRLEHFKAFNFHLSLEFTRFRAPRYASGNPTLLSVDTSLTLETPSKISFSIWVKPIHQELTR